MRKALLLTTCGYLLVAPALLLGATPSTTTTATGTNATTLLNQLSTAFSGGNVVHQVQLTGSASWHVGSLNDTGSATLSAATTGSSQLQLSLSYSGANVTSADGKQINAPVNNQASSGTITDTNGNQISNNGNGTFADTLGTTVLTITGSGTPTSPKIFQYNTPSGTATVTVTYQAYTVRTNFGCPSGDFNLSEDLVNTITLADGSVYTFNYEATPGYSGDVTGRLAKLTLPQGGAITYQYTGANNGIVCADGTPAGLTRLTPDGHPKFVRTV